MAASRWRGLPRGADYGFGSRWKNFRPPHQGRAG